LSLVSVSSLERIETIVPNAAPVPNWTVTSAMLARIGKLLTVITTEVEPIEGPCVGATEVTTGLRSS